MERLFDWGDRWVVRKPNGSVVVLKTSTGKPAAEQRAPKRLRPEPWVSADGRYVARAMGIDWPALPPKTFGLFPQRLPSNVLLVDLQAGTARELPIGYFALFMNRDRQCPLHEVGIRFDGSDRVRFISIRPDTQATEIDRAIKAGAVEVVSVSLPTGSITRRVAQPADQPRALDGPAPLTLAQTFASMTGFGPTRRAGKFLRALDSTGSDATPFPLCVKWSPDNRQFLAWMPSGRFVHADTRARTAQWIETEEIEDPWIVFLR